MATKERRKDQHIVDSKSQDMDSVLATATLLRSCGLAIHWLKPRSKAPIDVGWSEAPVLSVDDLEASYREGNNLGVRLGEPSLVGDSYLHCIDVDIRNPDAAEETWAALANLLPNVDLGELPCVASGSGGESRHLYFLTDKPFRSERLWTSAGKHRRVKDGTEGWSFDAELELFGTSKQVACPPSIHPDTGQPYRWLREFNFAVLDLGIGPFVPSADVERLQVAEHAVYEFETREPLTFTAGQLGRTLAAIPVSDLHYDDWIRLGQALHHQFGGSDEGFDLWLEHTRRSTKFTGDKQVREMRRVKWRSFGRYRGKPVTMATVIEWAKDARIADLRASFDDEDALHEGEVVPVHKTDGIGDDTSVGDFEDILGGEDDDSADEVDDIDAIGSNIAVNGQSRAATGDWISLLDLGEKGEIRGTLHNVELIVANDPRLAALPQLNEFTQEVVQRTLPGTKANRRQNAAKATRQLAGPVWQVRDPVNGDLWSDDRDFAIRSILEAPATQGGYGIKITDRDLKAATVLSASQSRFHPVREYLASLIWDGRPRVERLFVEFLGAPDMPYTRGVARLMMVGAAARIFEPGHKADHVVILEGLQGKRKSTFIKVLARHWFAELDADWHDTKQLVELMQGAWIMELPELSGFGKADVRTIKAFVSRQRDKVRLAYARRAGEFPRQCIFIGSTNDRSYLLDDTGGRRWWPIECSVEQIDTDRLEREIDQMWAEAVVLYYNMREIRPYGTLPLYLSDEEASEEALRMQESRRAESPEDMLAGQIGAWLDRPVVSGDISGSDEGTLRNETCCPEIWLQCLGKTDLPTQANSQLLGRALRATKEWEFVGKIAIHPRYGKQRIWERGGLGGRLARAT